MKAKNLLLSILILCTNSIVHGQNLQSGLLGYFNFTNGSTADSAGVGMAIIATDGVHYASTDECGRATDAMYYVNGYHQINNTGLLDFGFTGNFSFVTSFKTASSANQDFFTVFSPSQGWMAGLLSSQAGRVSFQLGGGDAISISTINLFNDNVWHQAVFTVDRSTQRVKIFVDTVQQNLNNNLSTGTIVNSNELDISQTLSNGSPGTDLVDNYIENKIGRNFAGTLDEIRFYNRALTHADIVALNSLRDCTVGIDDPAGNNKLFSVGPSVITSDNFITVSVREHVKNADLIIYNHLGQQVYSEIITESKKAVSFNFKPGIYFVCMTDGSRTWTERIIKQ